MNLHVPNIAGGRTNYSTPSTTSSTPAHATQAATNHPLNPQTTTPGSSSFYPFMDKPSNGVSPMSFGPYGATSSSLPSAMSSSLPPQPTPSAEFGGFYSPPPPSAGPMTYHTQSTTFTSSMNPSPHMYPPTSYPYQPQSSYLPPGASLGYYPSPPPMNPSTNPSAHYNMPLLPPQPQRYDTHKWSSVSSSYLSPSPYPTHPQTQPSSMLPPPTAHPNWPGSHHTLHTQQTQYGGVAPLSSPPPLANQSLGSHGPASSAAAGELKKAPVLPAPLTSSSSTQQMPRLESNVSVMSSMSTDLTPYSESSSTPNTTSTSATTSSLFSILSQATPLPITSTAPSSSTTSNIRPVTHTSPIDDDSDSVSSCPDDEPLPDQPSSKNASPHNNRSSTTTANATSSTGTSSRKRPRRAHMMTDRQRRAKIRNGMEELKQILAQQGMFVTDQVSIMLSSVQLLHSLRSEMSDLHHAFDLVTAELKSVHQVLATTHPTIATTLGQRIQQLTAHRQSLAVSYAQARQNGTITPPTTQQSSQQSTATSSSTHSQRRPSSSSTPPVGSNTPAGVSQPPPSLAYVNMLLQHPLPSSTTSSRLSSASSVTPSIDKSHTFTSPQPPSSSSPVTHADSTPTLTTPPPTTSVSSAPSDDAMHPTSTTSNGNGNGVDSSPSDAMVIVKQESVDR